MSRDYLYARLCAGSRYSWLRLLAQGWMFTDLVVEPMGGHHGRHAVLMWRQG